MYEYIISPDHDVFMIMASDGLWNALSPQRAVDLVNSFRQDELKNDDEEVSEFKYSKVAEALLEEALHEWCRRRRAADNITIMIVYFFETEEPPAATGSTKVHCYYRPSAALSEIRYYQRSTEKVAIPPTDIQLARRIVARTL